MKSLQEMGIRRVMSLFALVSMLPAIAITGLLVWMEARKDAAEAKSAVLEAARNIAFRQNAVIERAVTLLQTLSTMPELADPALCPERLRSIAADQGWLTGLFIAGPDGVVFCDDTPSDTPVTVGDRDYFQTAMATGQASVSGLIRGRSSGRLIVVVALPQMARDGSVQRVMAAPVDAGWLDTAIHEEAQATGAVVLLVDSLGYVVAGTSADQIGPGGSIAGTPLLDGLRTRRPGTLPEPARDGYVYGFAPLSNTGTSVVVGLPRTKVLASVQTNATIALVLLGVAAIAGGALARLFADRAIVDRLALLDTALERLTRGETGARTNLPPGRDEIARLARNLDSMADALEQRQRDLEDSRDEARAAVRARTQFLAMMGHELRTPLNGVLGMASVLLDGDLAVDQRDQVRLIRESASSLMAILDDILDFSRLEAGRIQIRPVDTDIRSLVTTVCKPLETQLRDRPVRMAVSVAADVPAWLRVDAVRLRQLLFNLVGNAVKFTHQGRVDVRVALQAEPLHLVVRIEDTGIGMTGEQLSRVFRPFEQADQTTTRRYGGTGLGLSIVKGLLEAMGGTLQVESRHGVGTRFRISLPVAPGTAPAGPPADSADGAGRAEVPARVLLVDDLLPNRTLIRVMLERDGHGVVEAVNGAEAVAAIRDQGPFDLVFMDIQMPVMDGLEATRAIRGFPGSVGHIPIIGVSADDTLCDPAIHRRHGFTDFLRKPLDLQQVRRAVRLSGRSDAAALAPPPRPDPTPREAVPALPLLDIPHLRTLEGQLGADMVRTLLMDLAVMLDRCVQQAAAAVAGDDPATLRTILHGMQGAAGNLGCRRLEAVLRTGKQALDAGRPIDWPAINDIAIKTISDLKDNIEAGTVSSDRAPAPAPPEPAPAL